MIDFVKIYIPLNGMEYVNDKLNFKGQFNKVNAVVDDSKNFTEYKNFKIITRYNKKTNGDGNAQFIPSFLEVKGSLHYTANFHNSAGMHNYNLFDYKFLNNTIDELSALLNIEPNQMIIKNLEYGVNLETTPDVDDILQNLIIHNRTQFVQLKQNGFNYNQCEHSDFIIKAYNKGKQFKLSTNLIRIEIKYLRTRIFNEYGIINLNDLKDLDKLFLLQQDLIKRWNECILFEPIGTDISKLEQRDWSNANYWLGLEKNYRNKYYRERIKFDKYIDAIANNVKTEIEQGLNNKWCKFHTNAINYNNSQVVQIPPLDIVGNCTTLDRCIITGEPITDQKKGSKFLSAKKLGYKGAHDLRNRHSNPRNNLRRRIKRLMSENYLFDNTALIKLDERHKEYLSFWNGTMYDMLSKIDLNR